MDQQLLFLINHTWAHPALDRLMAVLSSFDFWWPFLVTLLVIAATAGGFRMRAMLLAAGLAIAGPNMTQFTLSHTILEGHRFAVRPIPEGAPLLSWGKTFGRALRDIMPGEYVCNAGVPLA